METKTNTDPKPHIFYFNSDSDTLLEIFFNKIKPMCGIIKYKMVNWDSFPSSISEAKTLAESWTKKFKTNSLYDDYKVIIYFHLEKKTIRFELKNKKNIIPEYFEIEETLDVENKIILNKYLPVHNYIFNCNKTNYFDNYDLEKCKNKAVELSKKLEFIHQYKFIIFLNIKEKSIHIKTT